MPATYTPLRFPGGKTKLYDFIKPIVAASIPQSGRYVEPFAGGAGLAMKLLLKDDVSEVVINDYDRLVYCIWKSILSEDDALIHFVESVDISIDEWNKQKHVVSNQQDYDDETLGHAAFYLNRTNVSGILMGGPIGGKNQTGNFKIDARFSRDGLINKIIAIREVGDRISLFNYEAADFISQILPRYDKESTFIYFDPPYVEKGPQLYKNALSQNDHASLAKAISALETSKWIVTYDDCPYVRELYSPFEALPIEVGYSAGSKRVGIEIAFFSKAVSETRGTNG